MLQMMEVLKEEPLVSILMPVYNGETTINYAINSLLKQTWKYWECIIVDDGSSDNTAKILDEVSDERFSVIKLKNNGGRGNARQLALNHARGNYIAYLDADDLIHSDKLKSQVEFLESHPEIALVGCGGITMSKNYEPLQVTCDSEIQESNIYHYGQNLPLLMASIMIRASIAKLVSYNLKLDVGEDYDYFSRCLEGKKYANMPKPYYYYLIGTYTKGKIVSYNLKNLQTFKEMYKNGAKVKGVIGYVKGIFKLLSYLVLLPILGVDRLMNLRGNGATIDEFNRAVFENQINVFF